MAFSTTESQCLRRIRAVVTRCLRAQVYFVLGFAGPDHIVRTLAPSLLSLCRAWKAEGFGDQFGLDEKSYATDISSMPISQNLLQVIPGRSSQTLSAITLPKPLSAAVAFTVVRFLLHRRDAAFGWTECDWSDGLGTEGSEGDENERWSTSGDSEKEICREGQGESREESS